MASAVAGVFSTWLNEKLKELNTDETVFGSYITSIVEGDETTEEKIEALQGILAEIIEDSDEITRTCDEILEKWQFHKPKEVPPSQFSSEDVDSKLVKLLESQSLATTKPKKYTEEQKKIRDAILTQYSQMTDDEDDEENQAAGGGVGSSSGTGDHHKENGLEKNLNAQSVFQAEKVKREQARIDSQKKKDKDKEDREKQKQLREEKKEKRKTQKGERRR